MGVPSDPTEGAAGPGRPPGATSDHGSMVEAMDSTVGHATHAIEDLKELLRRLEALAALAREHEQNEAKIGELFLRVQDYVAKASAEAEQRARTLVAEAETEAAKIVSSAQLEAQRIVAEARRTGGIPPEALQQLHGTVDRFAQLNAELVRELSALNEALVRRAAPPSSPPPPGAAPPPPPRPRVVSRGEMPPVSRPGTTAPPPPPPARRPDRDRLGSILHRAG